MVEIRPLTPEDWSRVEAIWAEGIDTRNATFETETPSWASFDATRHPEHRLVMTALVAGADAGGIWTIQTSVFPENAASLALHEHVGFRVVGTRERVAQLNGVWRDTLFLERRSAA